MYDFYPPAPPLCPSYRVVFAQSNHSNTVAAMREVEACARAAGGKVWVLIRDRSQQRGSDSAGEDDDGDSSESNADDSLGPWVGVQSVGQRSPMRGVHGGGNAGSVSPLPSWQQQRPDNGNTVTTATTGHAPEWVLSRLDRMRSRGSFIDGDEFGLQRSSSTSAVATFDSSGGGGGSSSGGSQGVRIENAAESFASLAQRAGGDGVGSERGETDEALAALQADMLAQATALSRLAGWMAHAVPVTADEGGAGNQLLLNPTSQLPSAAAGVGVTQFSRDLDFLEAKVKRERFRAHGAAEEEIHQTPELYKEACALGNALILRGHDYLAQVIEGGCAWTFFF